MKSKHPRDGKHQGDGHWGVGEGGEQKAGAAERDLSFPKTQTRKRAAEAGCSQGVRRLTQWRGASSSSPAPLSRVQPTRSEGHARLLAIPPTPMGPVLHPSLFSRDLEGFPSP